MSRYCNTVHCAPFIFPQFWAPTDPYEALANHRRVNNPGDTDHLFAYHLRPLTKHALIKVDQTHSHRSSSRRPRSFARTWHQNWCYLLHGVPFEAVKVRGRWSSDALRYLRKHAQILTPYIQADSNFQHSQCIFLFHNAHTSYATGPPIANIIFM
jgi:hypothetical protein